MGVSGRRMIEAMIGGVRNPRRLAELADRRLKATPKELYDALHGRLSAHHGFLLKLHLGQYDVLAAAIEEIDGRIETQLSDMDAEVAAGQAPFRALIRLISEIPGVSTLSATAIVAEIGRDMSLFSDRRAPCRMGGVVSRSERKRRQAQGVQTAQRRAVAEDHARVMRLGRPRTRKTATTRRCFTA